MESQSYFYLTDGLIATFPPTAPIVRYKVVGKPAQSEYHRINDARQQNS